jgi:type II secretory pathway component GspD/PulD (secretin)
MGTSGANAELGADAGTFGGPGAGWDFSDGWPANRFGPSILTVIGATLTLDFLRSQSDTKTLARPRILTLNNETAEIKITTDESVNPSQTTSGTSGLTTSTSSVERKETGVSLRVSPQINPDTNEVTMFIMPRIADTKAGIDIPTSGGQTIHVKDPEERSTKSVVRVKDGDTVVIGGLIRNEFSQTIAKVPLLGDIPVLGALFRHKDVDKNRERELLIFITPHIIKEGNVTLAKTDKVNLLEREQDNVSGVDRRTLIETSLNSFDKGR